MNILFDLTSTQPLGTPFHGGSEYAKTVFNHLIKRKGRNDNLFGVYLNNDSLDPDIKASALAQKVKLIPVSRTNNMADVMRNKGITRFFSASPYNYYNTDFSGINVIYTIHGLRTINMPSDLYSYVYSGKNFPFYKNISAFRNYLLATSYLKKEKVKFNKTISVKSKSKTLIASSEHTKYSMLYNAPKLNKKDVKVIYCPNKDTVKFSKSYEDKILKKYNLTSKGYFLIISANRWYKNSYRAIRALDNIFTRFPNVNKKAVILGCGKVDFKKHVRKKDKFIFGSYVESQELECLYKNAFCFIYPTLDEGFGYPPLESMKYGTPVLCSAISSVPEICGQAVLYFNPFSIDEISQRVLQVSLDTVTRDYLCKTGLEHYSNISTKQDGMLDELCNIILNRF